MEKKRQLNRVVKQHKETANDTVCDMLSKNLLKNNNFWIDINKLRKPTQQMHLSFKNTTQDLLNGLRYWQHRGNNILTIC